MSLTDEVNGSGPGPKAPLTSQTIKDFRIISLCLSYLLKR